MVQLQPVTKLSKREARRSDTTAIKLVKKYGDYIIGSHPERLCPGKEVARGEGAVTGATRSQGANHARSSVSCGLRPLPLLIGAIDRPFPIPCPEAAGSTRRPAARLTSRRCSQTCTHRTNGPSFPSANPSAHPTRDLTVASRAPVHLQGVFAVIKPGRPAGSLAPLSRRRHRPPGKYNGAPFNRSKIAEYRYHQ